MYVSIVMYALSYTISELYDSWMLFGCATRLLIGSFDFSLKIFIFMLICFKYVLVT